MESCCSEVFWSLVITTLAGLCVVSCKLLYKSKCKKVAVCGIAFERDIESEVKEDLEMIHNKMTDKESSL